ncbi:MAG: hypothetical protein UX80_C0006G0037 [Candidatus Amesbacteria bacterium GW2011_GWA2_47_11b]|uniref:Uncharacterized protein n=3 Tax=Candidatus Amesiibacteriota TaxID=1752730 RepID=A0A0G1USY2_9BACT|nr:MAG: hypothetical protein UX42_C0003G0032 [Microgenomates group bacterium GW2011_GWC1_46_20]KKU58067.1 MAG: hypothetical protein UX80_C0006G0037 [Candidatus Amesbacteria bacterium GW2011_GWA2_47_11b]KKU69118.1 MAG: hypothetical protein UX92_C0014G0009 [Candidatus Amesbacteria bacterium GW2011_GWA1_47_20]KKU84032.1 MAG: hypothetical protein UY11_C0007G0011 [Candidatus Amesbacteria bacterium GW2011_GWC2_47_8]
MRAMTSEQGLLIYASIHREKMGRLLQEIAEQSCLYNAIVYITNYQEFNYHFLTGLAGITKIAAVYDATGTAISIMNAVDWIYSENKAIIGVSNPTLCDAIRTGLVPRGVLVFGKGSGYKGGITPRAFVAGKIS